MKVNKKEVYYCDVCGAEILNFYKDHTFYFQRGWSSGSHTGEIECEGHCCSRCLDSKLRRYLACLWAKLMKK